MTTKLEGGALFATIAATAAAGFVLGFAASKLKDKIDASRNSSKPAEDTS